MCNVRSCQVLLYQDERQNPRRVKTRVAMKRPTRALMQVLIGLQENFALIPSSHPPISTRFSPPGRISALHPLALSAGDCILPLALLLALVPLRHPRSFTTAWVSRASMYVRGEPGHRDPFLPTSNLFPRTQTSFRQTCATHLSLLPPSHRSASRLHALGPARTTPAKIPSESRSFRPPTCHLRYCTVHSVGPKRCPLPVLTSIQCQTTCAFESFVALSPLQHSLRPGAPTAGPNGEWPVLETKDNPF